MLTFLGILLVIALCQGLEEAWYRGCVSDDIFEELSVELNASSHNSVAECTQHCATASFMYAGVQEIIAGERNTKAVSVDGRLSKRLSGAQLVRQENTKDKKKSTITDGQGNQSKEAGTRSMFTCVCLNNSSESFDSCNDSLERRSKNDLPAGITETSWAVYTSEGPYLTTVVIETDNGFAVIDKPVPIEIHVARLAATNVTDDNFELGHQLDIQWMVRENGTVVHDYVTMGDFTKILHRPKYIFNKPGNYSVDVEVSNGISTKQASLALEVVYPAPRDLQITIPDDNNIPSCIPEQFMVTEHTGQTFAVFVDTPLQFDSAVAMGTNLTFSFHFEDTNDDEVIQLCENCTSVSIEHVFEETGMFQLLICVDNLFGHVEKSITVVVIQRQFSNLSIDLYHASEHITAIGQPVHFIVSLLTTSRENRSLQVWYGDGRSNIVSLADTKSPRLVLAGDGKEMEIIASYGEGCRLLVEFKYAYETEGTYRPKIAVFENKKFDSYETGFGHFKGVDLKEAVTEETGNEMTINYGIYEHSPVGRLQSNGVENSGSAENMEDILNEELGYVLLILSEISGARIHAAPVGRCEEPLEINLLVSSMLNVSVHWGIYRLNEGDDMIVQTDSYIYESDDYSENDFGDESNLVLIFERKTSDRKIIFMFSQVGDYIVKARVQNAISSMETRFDVIVQCPIKNMVAKCTDEFIQTGAELTCWATVQRGSDIVFYWSIEGIMTETYTQFENHTSFMRHRFKTRGIYDISVEAMNNISKSCFEVESPINVQDAIKNINMLKIPPYLVGNLTKVIALYQPAYRVLYYIDLDVKFDFDFGSGRENFGLQSCDELMCYEQAGYVFHETGMHEVIVYAYNDVSEIAVTKEVHIFAGLDNITVLVTDNNAAGTPARFVVLQNGKTMETADVYFTWLFREDTEVFYTNSPVVDVVFNLPGNYTVSVNLKNRVDFRVVEVPVFIESKSEVKLWLLHDVCVTPRTDVNFDLQVNTEVSVGVGSEVRVSYSDGQSEVHKQVPFKWVHIFHEVGTKQIDITVVDSLGTSLETLTSYLVVQEPVTGLKLAGPVALAYHEYESSTWEAISLTGTNILYNWTLVEDSILIPKSQYEIRIPEPGNYTLRVEAFNDVTKQPLSAELSFLVQNVIEDVDLEVVGNLVGKPTEIVIYVAGYYDFMAEINYGDGENEFVYSFDPVVMVTSDGDLKVYLSHIYEFPGEYNVTVNVSNSVSSVILSEIFIPIEDITLTTRSPWVIKSTGHVVIKAIITGGRDLRFTWNFSDSRTYEKPMVASYPNQTSIAKHFYRMSGEYCVTFNVMGHNYPDPGVYAKLDRCFLVVDPIDTVKLSASSNSSALEMNSTLPVVFTARLSGSHVVFYFDFGDGTKMEVPGSQLSPWNKDMTMFAEGTHSFKAVGKYKVKVIADNPLGNQTAELPFEFWVQVPPKDLQFYDGLLGETVSRYVGKVGELVTMCAKVTSGTDVLFDWKLGDQTDLVKKGSVVTHQYMTPGVKTVYVTAYNKVRTLTRAVKVYINYEIQGVDLIVERTVISVGQEMMYSAIVHPDYPNIVSEYKWVFKSPSHGRFGGIQNYASKQSAVPYTFLFSGECTATVTAQNAISIATSASVEIHVHQPIQFAEIFIYSNKANRLVNQPITFKYHANSGTSVNLTWSFGDSSSPVITNIPEVEHTFTSEEAYNVTALAQNPVSSQTVHKMLFILNKSYCVEPKVSIIADKEMKVLHSRYFTVEADVNTDCNLTSVVAYHWSIDGHMTLSAVQMEKRVLVLPPRMLNYGMHTIEFKVEVVGTIVFAAASRTFEVVASPLVSRIQGGIFRLIRNVDPVVIDGSNSFDPDTPDNNHLRYNWRCHYLLANGTYGESCFHHFIQDAAVNVTQNASCTVAMNTAVMTFSVDCLMTASNYTFELTVSADGRQNGSSLQTIAMEPENSQILDVKIIRPYSILDPVNADRKLSFYVECTNCDAKGIKYKWTIKHLAGYDIFNYARAHDLPCVDSDGTVYLQLRENVTDSTVEPTQAANRLPMEEISPGDSNGVIQELLPVTFGPDIDPEAAPTTVPLYPYVPIAEGKPNTDRRQRYPVKDISNIDFPRVEEQLDSARRIKPTTRTFDIVEEIQANGGRVPRFQVPIEEGTPGESGSSGGRQYSFSTLGRSTFRDTVDETDSEETGSGIRFLDKLEGNRKDISRQQSILELPMVHVNLLDEQTRTGLDGESLVIKPGFLKQGLTYFLEVTLTNKENGQYGKAVSSFEVNESPVDGRCSIKPDNGIELDTEFRVVCKAWQDEHKPLMYEISYKLHQSEGRKLVYRGVNGEIPVRLPAGKPDNDYSVYVYIDILDGLLAKTSVCSITIRVTPKTLSDQSGQDWYADAKLIYDEIVSTTGALQKSVDNGDDAMSKVFIIYLASWLNRLNDSANTLHQEDSLVTYNIENSNATYISERIIGEKADSEYRRDARRELLKVLEKLPVRDEAEVLQSAQALAVTTAVPEQLDNGALYLSLKVLEYVCSGAETVYQDELTPTGDLVHLVVASASSIIKGTMDMAKKRDKMLEYMYKDMIEESIKNVEKLVLNELKYHLVSEEPVMSSCDFLSVWASRHSTTEKHSMSIGKTKFQIPRNLGTSVLSRNTKQSSSMIDNISVGERSGTANQRCAQSHMTSFKLNPYDLENRSKVHSEIGGLSIYNCNGQLVSVENLEPDDQIHVDLPNIQPKAVVFPDLYLNKWSMNVHQFNITANDLKHALHFLINLAPVKKGRLFPISVLLSFTEPPSPDFYKLKYDFEAGENNVDIFLPAGSFNATGMYYIGIVDSTYNSARLRPGQVTQRNYTLKLWWAQCLYWNGDKEVWLPDGCTISGDSTFEVTKCTCHHLTSFGGRFELIPNKLTLSDIDGFFSPHRNSVTLTLMGAVVVIYCLLLVWCYRVDLYDNRKGGIVYLLDNSPVDQQKFEITVETGCWRGAGTTAKISIILHGEEGMSETRELISEDDRPMFERNSRDKFILSLPDSIGRIWKVQIWHNNFGSSPSWYLGRVIVRDLNTGNQYMFICEKWLAVEEQDGKVEREFMALDSNLKFGKAFTSIAVEYMTDFHTWMSLVTCPPYSGFMRTERLTVCLTMLMAYMCLNAMWYKISVTEFRGEFGLLDVSWRNVTVGAICCGVVIPIGRLLEFLFRRSKPKHASSSQTKDEVTDWEPDYPSGKPNEQESEDSSEQVQPIMTYSLLDQSILNWPNIQSWAQKQWIKRQLTGRAGHDSHSGNSSSHSGDRHGSNGSGTRVVGVNPVDLSVINTQGIPELDQASSGFEDCSSLIRPKASMDSTHTTAAPSVNESTRVHKPQSLADSLRISTKLPSESDFEKTSKAPSISSSGSNKSSMLQDKKTSRMLEHLYLPYWCRYVAWGLCGVICVGCVTVTVMYGYRFGTLKSTLWLQSLYFSVMICVFISNPILILAAILYAVWVHKKDPSSVDNYGYDIFNRQKAKEDLFQWKKQLEAWDEGEALERGVAARQRSRYLRFARPPQEKQLIEARKRVMKEKKAVTIFRETVTFMITAILLIIMAYCKDVKPSYYQNTAVKNTFLGSGDFRFTSIKSRDEWYMWAGTSLPTAMASYSSLHDRNMSSSVYGNTYMIGQVQLRQQRIQANSCSEQLPYIHSNCLYNSITKETRINPNIQGISYTSGYHGDFMFGWHGVYDGVGYIFSLNTSRSEAMKQLEVLKSARWLDRRTHAVLVELTLYNTQSNLFTAVKMLAEMSHTGDVCTRVKVTSAQLFRYVTTLDNVLLACELLFFVLMMLSVKNEAFKILAERTQYFTTLWNILSFLLAVTSLVFGGCFIYRFAIIADTVETLRSSYYEKYVSVSFITFWDEMLQSFVAILLFLCFGKCLHLLRFYKQFAVFGEIYRKARREMVIFFAGFCVILAAYTSMGHVLFGSMVMTFRDLWSSLLGVTALLTGSYSFPEFQSKGQTAAARVYLFTFCVFGIGFLAAYMIAVLSHYFRTRKRRRLLVMNGKETILFYWNQFQLWTGLQKPKIEEEPVVILPPEFTMAEIEYQVDELLFRMNALTGSHGLPEKPPCYLTDSDCTYGGGDDGISSAGSEAGVGYVDDRLEQRVQKIEDNLCSQEPFLAQLLKFDTLGAEDLSQEREKQLRSHLELEIFRQLQIQRQDLKSPTEENANKGSNSTETDEKGAQITPHSPGQDSTSSDEVALKQTAMKPVKPRRTRSSLKVQTIHDLIAKTTHDLVESHDNSSSNPDSPRDKIAFAKLQRPVDGARKPIKQNSSSSSSEKISPDLSLTHTNSLETETIKKPTKPTFLHSRDSSLSDGPKGSPILKLRTSCSDKGQRLETNPLVHPESSSGSEQDGLQIGKKLFGRRSLRKTKSRGKGKGPDSLEPALILDELEGEEAESYKVEVDLVEVLLPSKEDNLVKGVNDDKFEVKEQLVRADVHQSN